jgi:hypothetical protein
MSSFDIPWRQYKCDMLPAATEATFGWPTLAAARASGKKRDRRYRIDKKLWN